MASSIDARVSLPTSASSGASSGPAVPMSSPDAVSHSAIDWSSTSSRPKEANVAARSWRLAERWWSTARFRAIVSSQLRNVPRAGSNSSARFQRARNVSWTTSAAIQPSRLVRWAAA
jgi:hypothetical protein